MDDFGVYCRPSLVQFMEAVGLDAVYERAEGNRLWRRQGSEHIPILDLVGGYGAGLYGHNHPALVAEARRLLDTQVPIHVQGSVRSGAGRLAKALCELLGDYIVIFTNSGTETVEAALKHAYLSKKKTSSGP